MSTDVQRLAMAKSILNFEASWDKEGRLAITNLRSDDGGGSYEVAGINVRYNPAEAEKLATLINNGEFDAAETEACEYIAQLTDAVARWTTVAAIEAYLRDCYFNRGNGGATWMLRAALGLPVSQRNIDSALRAAISAAQSRPQDVLTALRQSRERYERE
ncbi:MAG: hypothetical protein ACLPXB_04280, partial [Thiobacillaceae bacterium]